VYLTGGSAHLLFLSPTCRHSGLDIIVSIYFGADIWLTQLVLLILGGVRLWLVIENSWLVFYLSNLCICPAIHLWQPVHVAHTSIRVLTWQEESKAATYTLLRRRAR
jgi:hypothetical protein